MSFVKRDITLTLSLGTGDLGEGPPVVVKIEGLRCSVLIEKLGAASLSTAIIRVYGLTQSLMNRVSSLWVPMPDFRDNRIVIEVGDAVSGMNLAFEGGLQRAMINPEIPGASLSMMAMTAYKWKAKPAAALSFPGPTDAATIIAQIAATMGYGFQNNGVRVILSNPYLPGTAVTQLFAVQDAADFEMTIDDKVIAIWPKNGKRGSGVTVVSAQTGMAGYPTYDGSSIELKTLYNPGLLFGGGINVESLIPPARGVWYIWHLVHNLQTQTPGGNWFSEISARRSI